MPRWRLSLPPPAAPISPSRLHRSSSPIAVNSPSRGPLMSSCSRAVHHHPSPSITVHRHAVHHRQVAIAPSLSVHHHCNRSPSTSRSRCLSPYITITEPSRHPSPPRSRRAIHCCRAAPSLTVEEPSIAVNPSTAFKSPLHRPLLSIAVQSPSCRTLPSHHAVHHRQVAIAPSFAVHRRCNHSPSVLHSRHPSPSIAAEKPPRLPSPSSRHRVVHRCPSPSITFVIAVHHHRCLSSGWLLRFLSSRRRLLSTGSGVSARHVQPFSDARHYSLSCWEAACIVLRQI